MASKLVGLLIFAVFLNTISATKNITLNIGRYKPEQDPNKPAPNPYKIFEFSPKKGKKLTRVVLGPVVIYEDLSEIWSVVSFHLETLNLVPQLAKLILTDGANTAVLFYRWDKYGFVEEQELDHSSYKVVLTSNVHVSTTPYVDIKRQINFMVFDITTEILNEIPLTIVKPKEDFTLHLVISGNDSIVKSDEPILSIKGYRLGEEFKTVEASFDAAKPTLFFILVEKTWIQCDNQQFLETSKKYHEDYLKTQMVPTVVPTPVTHGPPPTPPSIPEGPDLSYTLLHTKIKPPDPILLDQMVVTTPMERPATPLTFVPRTPPFPNSVVVDLNKISSSFTVDSTTKHEFEVLTVHPNEGISVFEAVETGYTLWHNRRGTRVVKIELLLRNKLVVLVTIFTNRAGLRRLHFARNFGRLYPCSQPDFNQLFESWKSGPAFDNTISFSTHLSNNTNLFNKFEMLNDGVQYTSPVPLQGYNFVRLNHGTHEVFQEPGETWTHITINVFNSTNSLVTIGVFKDGQQTEKYFDSKGVLLPLDFQSFSNQFFQFHTGIHHQANVLFDLTKEIRHSYISQNGDDVNIVPLSGYHVRFVTFGKVILWWSLTHRCLSIQFYFDNYLKRTVLVKLIITADNITVFKYFRLVGNSVFKVETEAEFSFLVQKHLHNKKNENHRVLTEAAQSHNPNTNYNPQIVDLSNYTPNLTQYSRFDEYVLRTVFIPDNGSRFHEVRFGNQTLWTSNLVNGVCLKISAYYHGGLLKLLKIFSYLNGAENIEYILFNEGFVEAIPEDVFQGSVSSLKDAFDATIIPVDPKVVILDLTDAANYNPIADRTHRLVTISYHNTKLPFNVLTFGAEIMWVGADSELASHVRVYYYEHRPILAELKMTPSKAGMKHLSNFNRSWHILNSNGFESLINRIRGYEYLRERFTLPNLGESTPFDDNITIDGNLIIRSFFSQLKLIASLFYHRARIYCPTLYSYIHSLYVCYHDSLPKLLSFKEVSIYGYTYNHHLVFRNGWRPVPYSKFLQFFQYYRHSIPKNSAKPSSFDYDISSGDPRVHVSKLDDPVDCYRHQLSDTQQSLSSISSQGTVIWSAPKHINLRKFFIYMHDNIPLLARVEEEDHTHVTEDIFLRLEGDEWKEIDYHVFSAEYAELAQQALIAAPPLPSGTGEQMDVLDMTDQLTMDTSDALETLEPSELLETLPETTMETSQPSSPSPAQPTTGLSDTVFTPPAEPISDQPTDQTAGQHTQQPTDQTAGQHTPSLQPSVPGQPAPDASQTPEVPEHLILDLLGPFDNERFTFGKGVHNKYAKFDDVECKANCPVVYIKTGDKVVWHCGHPLGTHVRVRSFLKDGVPFLVQILTKTTKKAKKFVFAVRDEAGNWSMCSEDVFNVTLNNIVKHHKSLSKSKSSGT